MLLYTTQRGGRTGRRRHGGQRRRELRVEVRRGGGRRDRWRAERVGVRGVVGRHARPPPQFLHCFLERRDELVGHVGHLLDFPVKAHGLRREGVLVDRFWGPRGRRRGRGQSVVNKSQWSLFLTELVPAQFRGCASQTVIRRAAMRTNLDSFVGTALASVVQSWQIHGKPVLRQASQLPGWSQANSEASRRLAPRPSCSKVPRETRRGDAGPK